MEHVTAPTTAPPTPGARQPDARRSGCTGPVLGCLIGVGLVSVVGTALVIFVGWTMFVGQAEQALAAHPVIHQQIGELRKVTPQWSATINHQGVNTFVFRLEGSRASGTVEAELLTVDADTEALAGGVLMLDSGARFDLAPEAGTDGALVDEDE